MSTIIKIENVNLWYDQGKPIEVHALKNINIGIEKGDYAAFLDLLVAVKLVCFMLFLVLIVFKREKF